MTSAHNGYVALARQIVGQPKRQHVAIKRDEGTLILKDKEAAEQRVRELEARVAQLEALNTRLEENNGKLRKERDAAREALRGEGAKV